jgi:hypothetical protein
MADALQALLRGGFEAAYETRGGPFLWPLFGLGVALGVAGLVHGLGRPHGAGHGHDLGPSHGAGEGHDLARSDGPGHGRYLRPRLGDLPDR